jgi:hypothetical protein
MVAIDIPVDLKSSCPERLQSQETRHLINNPIALSQMKRSELLLESRVKRPDWVAVLRLWMPSLLTWKKVEDCRHTNKNEGQLKNKKSN